MVYSSVMFFFSKKYFNILKMICQEDLLRFCFRMTVSSSLLQGDKSGHMMLMTEEKLLICDWIVIYFLYFWTVSCWTWTLFIWRSWTGGLLTVHETILNNMQSHMNLITCIISSGYAVVMWCLAMTFVTAVITTDDTFEESVRASFAAHRIVSVS